MASITILVLFTIAITTISHPNFATSDLLSPLLSPIVDNFCKEVGCGRGKCKMSENNDFGYECECDSGWKQTLLSNNSAALKFLPCVIPNCTLDYTCSEAAPPAQSQQNPSNTWILDPCRWANCGGGACNKTSPLTYACECKEGFSNLFNNTGFPCFKECSIGGDCPNLGLTISNQSTTTSPSLPDSGANEASASACSLQQGVSHGIILLVISIAIAV